MSHVPCPTCNGAGRTMTARQCPQCHGSGTVPPAVDPHEVDRNLVSNMRRVPRAELSEWERNFAGALGRRMDAAGDGWRGLNYTQRAKVVEILGRWEDNHG